MIIKEARYGSSTRRICAGATGKRLPTVTMTVSAMQAYLKSIYICFRIKIMIEYAYKVNGGSENANN